MNDRTIAVIHSGAAWLSPGDEIPITTQTTIDRDTYKVLCVRPVDEQIGADHECQYPQCPARLD